MNNLNKTILSASILVVSFGMAQAQNITEAHEQSAANPQTASSFEKLQNKAEKGNTNAQFELGMMYLDGEGVDEDEEIAMEWIWEAADKGHAQAKLVRQQILTAHFTLDLGC